MGQFHVTLSRIKSIERHPRDEKYNIVNIFDYCVVLRGGNWSVGDLALYLPPGAILPDKEEWSHLFPRDSDGALVFPLGETPLKKRTVMSRKIKGIFSQGLVVKPPPGNWNEGDDLAEHLGILRAEEPEMISADDTEPPPQGWDFRTYGDIEPLRRYGDILSEIEAVVITEKIHGSNARFCFDGERYWAGSKNQVKAQNPASPWWTAFYEEGLEWKLKQIPRHIVFGEIFGKVQKMNYGHPDKIKFRAFDIFSIDRGVFLNHDEAIALAFEVNIDWVPILFRGPWSQNLKMYADGKSHLGPSIREGFVVKPIRERSDKRVGRVILKIHGEDFLLQK